MIEHNDERYEITSELWYEPRVGWAACAVARCRGRPPVESGTVRGLRLMEAGEQGERLRRELYAQTLCALIPERQK